MYIRWTYHFKSGSSRIFYYYYLFYFILLLLLYYYSSGNFRAPLQPQCLATVILTWIWIQLATKLHFSAVISDLKRRCVCKKSSLSSNTSSFKKVLNKSPYSENRIPLSDLFMTQYVKTHTMLVQANSRIYYMSFLF